MHEKFKLGTSGTIGTLILPGEPLIRISKRLNRTVQLTIDTCDRIVEGVKRGRFDLGLIESPIFDEELIYKEWMEDELVICSKMPLENPMDEIQLSRCKLLCRHVDSPTRLFIDDFFQQVGLTYNTFYSLSEIDNASAAIQGLKWSKDDKEHPTVAIVSQLSVEHEVGKSLLYQARIKNKPMIRKFYVLYDKKETMIQSCIDDIVLYLKDWK